MSQNPIEANNTQSNALSLLRQMLGSNITFRPGQWEAIEAVAIKKQRALVVQRTGWGKSLVYFLATKLLRETGVGPTLLISPLLSLMRNQIDMAGKIGVRAYTINSANQKEWKDTENALSNDACDIILISPERLNNDHFLKNLLPSISGKIGLFVVDEAHCISDWGHDFRPDYRRIIRILNTIPRNVPILATTATANNRVIDDIKSQMGEEINIYRGNLTRESLRLQNIRLDSQEERLAWLAENLPKFKGSGIIYCMTIADTERVANWLQKKGFSAKAYHGGKSKNSEEEIDRPNLENALIDNQVKILVVCQSKKLDLV
jgi:ATP-dependent DNA helicase RecQ